VQTSATDNAPSRQPQREKRKNKKKKKNEGARRQKEKEEGKNPAMAFEQSDGARSAAGRMTALSLPLNVREHRFQMHHCRR
jgi:hypothetical protein